MITCDNGLNFDKILEHAIELGANDAYQEDDEIKVLTDPEDFQTITEGFEKLNIKPKEASLTRISENTIEVNNVENAKLILKLMEKIEENDDVQNVYSNFEFTDDVEKALEL